MYAEARYPMIQRSCSKQYDRFIPNRSAMDMDYAHYMVTEGIKDKENRRPNVISPASEAYQKYLAESLGINRTRILEFNNKPSTPAVDPFPTFSSYTSKPIRRIPETSERTLDVPHILDDYCLNLLDWGNCNVLSIAIRNTVYLWDATCGATELVTFDGEKGPVTSVKWAPDGRHIAIGLNNSHVQLWDSTTATKLKTFKGGHRSGSRVAALDWNNNNHMLTTGGMDGQIINNDVRIPKHIVETYRGHHQEVCGLKWSASGRQLASGGSDNLLHIWDRQSMTSSSSVYEALHRLEDHTAAVKALAWCPFQTNLLASGGDMCIKLYNTSSGACLNSVDTGSLVSSVIWNKNERELLSSSGPTLTLWRYPSMVKMAELTEHTSRILYTTQSPNGCTIATAAGFGDESLKLWNVFETPAKPAPKERSEPFSHLKYIR